MARKERSAGVVICHGRGESRRYLLLDYGGHWDFPKGHLKKNETDEEAASRELREETGIEDVRLIPGFAPEIQYFFRSPRAGLIDKRVIFFLGQVDRDAVTLSHEHVGYAFLGFDEAMKRLTYANAREILRLAHEFLRESK